MDTNYDFGRNKQIIHNLMQKGIYLGNIFVEIEFSDLGDINELFVDRLFKVDCDFKKSGLKIADIENLIKGSGGFITNKDNVKIDILITQNESIEGNFEMWSEDTFLTNLSK